MDWTLIAAPLASALFAGVAAWVTFMIAFRVQVSVRLALAEKRGKEAFEIAKLLRDRLHALEMEIAKNYVSADKLNGEIVRLERAIEKLDASVDDLGDKISSLGTSMTEQIVNALRDLAAKPPRTRAAKPKA